MISFIKGKIDSVEIDSIVVDHNGLGWAIFYPHPESVSIGEEIKIYTYLHLVENDIKLFGFSSLEEKKLFLKLISVKGLGPKTALNMLAKASAEKVITAIEVGDVKYLKSMPGIGPKAASQIVLDLKGKLVPVAEKKANTKQEVLPKDIQDAADALANFGYKAGEITKAVNKMKETPNLSVQEYIKLGLRVLMNNKL